MALRRDGKSRSYKKSCKPIKRSHSVKRLLSVVGLILCIGTRAANADAIDDFVNSINTKWQQKDYSGIAQALATRLSSNPNDVLALSIKAYFNLYATGDVAVAHAAAESAFSAVDASGNAKARDIAQEMKDEVTSVPTGESGPLTTEQQNQLHALFPELPMIKKCAGLARMLQGS